jgi:mannan endo-1,4-beta-mannosidase
MRPRLALIAAAVCTLVLSLLTAAPAHADTGFRVQDGRLVDANGNDFILRGVNHAHTWYPQETGAIADIKALGANSVRVVLSSGQRWTRNDAADVSAVIAECRENRLICVLEVHDTTGYGEQAGAATLDQAVDYWIGVQDALAGQEPYVILNIGNEPFGNTGYAAWTDATAEAITRLRGAGFDHTIMVDAPNWGQDWTFTMRDNAAEVFAADPDRNTLFSIHMYGVFDTAAEIESYLGHFTDAGLPIAVGEFGHDHSDGNPDEDAILATAEELGIGYLGWSWSGNGGGVEYLDMVNGFDPNSLTPWGERLFNGENGIAATAEEASVFDGDPGPGPGPDPDPEAGCTAEYRVAGQWSGGFQGEVRVTAGDTAIRGWEVTWTFADGQTVTNAWNAAVTRSGADVTAVNQSYNGTLSAGGTTTFGFQGTHNGRNTVPEVDCAVRS